MGTKNEPGKFDCYANAAPDEPMFVLLARDPDAADLVEQWATARMRRIMAGTKPSTDWPMVEEAVACAAKMRLYYAKRTGQNMPIRFPTTISSAKP